MEHHMYTALHIRTRVKQLRVRVRVTRLASLLKSLDTQRRRVARWMPGGTCQRVEMADSERADAILHTRGSHK